MRSKTVYITPHEGGFADSHKWAATSSEAALLMRKDISEVSESTPLS